MANLQETPTWEAGIYQLETSDPVMGGENGIDNRAPRQLANRTLWLKNELARQIEAVNSGKLGKTENAVSATKLATARNIALTGAVSGNVNFDGSNNVSITATDDNSIGLVAYFAANTAPTGWLKANGAAVSRTTYAKLFAKIGTTFGAGDGGTTFNLPDLRGEFIRGFDDGRNVDGGRGFGSAQLDAFQGHARNLKRSEDNESRMHGYSTLYGAPNNTSPTRPAPNAIGRGDAWVTHDYLPHLNYGTPRVDVETRPRNIALLACIKY